MKKEFKAPKLVVKKIGAQQILAGSGGDTKVQSKVTLQSYTNVGSSWY